MTGRGQTAFKWSDGLDLDLTHGEMLMKGAVVMVHQPEQGDKVRLECHDLAAELKAPPKRRGAKASRTRTGSGSGGLRSKDAPKPELERVWAAGGIRLRHGRAAVHSAPPAHPDHHAPTHPRTRWSPSRCDLSPHRSHPAPPG